jgi:hypothetical protein
MSPQMGCVVGLIPLFQLALEAATLVALVMAFVKNRRESYLYLAGAWVFIVLHRIGAACGATASLIFAKAIDLDPSFRWPIIASYCNTAMMFAALFTMLWKTRRELVLPVVLAALPTVFFAIVVVDKLNYDTLLANKLLSAAGILGLLIANFLAIWRTRPVAAISIVLSGTIWMAHQFGYPDMADSPLFMSGLSLAGASFGLTLAWSGWEKPEEPKGPYEPQGTALDRLEPWRPLRCLPRQLFQPV